MTSLRTLIASRTFDASSELTSLNVNNGWTVTGGAAVSSATTASGTTKRFMLDQAANWAGVVEAQISIQDQVGLCMGVPASGWDGVQRHLIRRGRGVGRSIHGQGQEGGEVQCRSRIGQ